MKNNKFKFKIIVLILICFNFITNITYSSSINNEIFLDEDEKTEVLKAEFQEVLNSIFSNRNFAIVSQDTEGLKTFYDLNKKAGVWAYESEANKIKYFINWSEKQGAEFTDIISTLKVTRASEKEPNIFEIVCYVSTEFFYSYLDQPSIENRFKLGTCHYLNIKKENNSYIILKEWYTDPLADSLNLENIKSEEIKDFITSKEKPDWTIDERTQKAIDYAHKYCGISDDEEFVFKYNKDYKNFNPEGGDCANFASQILYEGGNFQKNANWNYSNKQGTKAWLNAQGFKNYMINSGRASYITSGNYNETYKSAFILRPGDIVAYEKKGRICHVSTVTGLDSKGYPLVTCHNTDRLLVPYDLGWSNSNIKFHFIDVHY